MLKTLFTAILLSISPLILCEPVFPIHNTGTEFPVDYAKYGSFSGIGTTEFSYTINNDMELADAVGDGIFPNNYSVYSDPSYRTMLKERRLIGDKWDFVNDLDIQACYFKWKSFLKLLSGRPYRNT